LVAGTLPDTLPAGYTLFATTQSGKRYIVGSIVTNAAFAGNEKYAAGRRVELTIAPSGMNNENRGDPWAALEALPPNTPTDIAADTAETFAAYFITDVVTGMVGADGTTNLLGASSYTTAAGLQTAIQTYLTANGGGTATVTGGAAADGYLWQVKIVSPGAAGDTALTDVDSGITFQDGIGINKASFLRENLD